MLAAKTKPADDSMGDIELVRRAQQGERSAFDHLVLRYQSKVMSVVSRYVAHRADIPDVVQETFVRAYRALHTFQGNSAFYTWVFRIAFNTSMNHVSRSTRHRANVVPLDQDVDPSVLSARFKDLDTPEALALSDEIRDALKEAVADLSDDLRNALLLREIEEMSYLEIASVVRCPVGTVRSRIARAREILDKRLQPLLG